MTKIIQVQAIDSDGLNDLANVSITVLDENDNAPRLVRPHPSKHVIWLAPTLQPGHVVTKLQVSDPDSGANGLTTFEIEGGSGAHLVEINQKGELILQKKLSIRDEGRYAVFVRISDQGEEQQFTSARVSKNL